MKQFFAFSNLGLIYSVKKSRDEWKLTSPEQPLSKFRVLDTAASWEQNAKALRRQDGWSLMVCTWLGLLSAQRIHTISTSRQCTLETTAHGWGFAMCCIKNSYFSHGAGSGHNFFRKRTASSALSELRLFRQNVFGLNIRRSRFNLKRFSLETATCSLGIKRDNILEMKFVLFLIISSQPYDPIISYENSNREIMSPVRNGSEFAWRNSG